MAALGYLAGGVSRTLLLDLAAVLVLAQRRDHPDEFKGLAILRPGFVCVEGFLAVRILGTAL